MSRKTLVMSKSSKPSIPKRFLGAFKAGHRSSSMDHIDEDFSYQLLYRILASNYGDTEAVEALDYITKFNDEFHKNIIKKGDNTALHNTDALRKDCYARENSKNRDISSVRHLNLVSLQDHHLESFNDYDQEEVLNDSLDKRDEWHSLLEHLDGLDDKQVSNLIKKNKRKKKK